MPKHERELDNVREELGKHARKARTAIDKIRGKDNAQEIWDEKLTLEEQQEIIYGLCDVILKRQPWNPPRNQLDPKYIRIEWHEA